MAFKIGTLSVAVEPDDVGFEDELRRQIAEAAAGIDAKVGLRLGDDAVISLNEDVLAAVELAAEGVKAHVGLGLKDDAVEGLDADVKAGIELVEADAKVKVSVDPKQATEAGAQGGGLLMAALGGAAALGAPALVAGLGAAFVGITAIALAENDVIAADYTKLANEAGNALDQAVEPLAPTLHAAVTSLEADLKDLQPTLDSTFANVGSDVTEFASGIDHLVANSLPGINRGLQQGQPIVADFTDSLGQLGTGAANFFTGLTRDSTTTGAGLEDVVSIASNALGTLGNIAGSASSAISADLMAVTPAVNGALDALDKLSNPATVGAAGGAFAAWKLGGPISTGLKSAASGLLDVAAKSAGAEGVLGKLSGAALSSGSGLEKMAGVMGGPWGIAIGAGVGLVSGLVGSLISASDATKAVTLSQQDLQQAVSQDGDAAGQATAAYVAATAASAGLSDTYKAAGVSTAEWTEAVLGSKDAQKQVIASVELANQQVRDQQVAQDGTAHATGKYAGELQDATQAVDASAAANNTLTDANQKVINSLQAQQKQVADTIAQQTDYEKAMAAVTNTESLFNAELTAAHEKLVATAQGTSLTTVGTLNLGEANYALNASLDKSVTAYSLAQSGGNAYVQVLDALNGGINTLLSSEAAFTTSLAGVTAAVKANGTSLDVNTAKGAANITAFTGIANAADKAAQAVYDQKAQTEGSQKAWNDANAKLKSEKDAFEQAAEKAGYNKQQVQALADELFKLPKDIPIAVDLKLNNASILDKVNSPKLRATGGPVSPTEAYIVGDGGRPEYFVPDTPGQIYPTVAAGQQAIAAHNARVTGGSLSPAGADGSGGGVTFQFFGSQYPTTEQMAQLNMQYATALGGV